MAENKKQEIDMAAVDAAVAEEVGKEMEEIIIVVRGGVVMVRENLPDDQPAMVAEAFESYEA